MLTVLKASPNAFAVSGVIARLPAISSLTRRGGRPRISASSTWLHPRASIAPPPNELTRRKHLSRSSLHYLHDHHLFRFIQW